MLLSRASLDETGSFATTITIVSFCSIKIFANERHAFYFRSRVWVKRCVIELTFMACYSTGSGQGDSAIFSQLTIWGHVQQEHICVAGYCIVTQFVTNSRILSHGDAILIYLNWQSDLTLTVPNSLSVQTFTRNMCEGLARHTKYRSD